MCGIAGYYRLPTTPFPDLELLITWASLANRGHDAAGAMWHTAEVGHVSFSKIGQSATDCGAAIWRFATVPTAPLWIALHTRAATHGAADNNDNNHPVRYGNILVQHNGVVVNKDEVFENLQLLAQSEVDTESVAACLDVGGLPKVLELCEGSMSLAWVDVRTPGTLHLYTNGGSPLYFGRAPCGGFSYASTATLLPTTLRPVKGTQPAGTHITLYPSGRVVQTTPGTGKTLSWVSQWAHSPMSNTWYHCFDPVCKQQPTGHLHRTLAFPYDLHHRHKEQHGK